MDSDKTQASELVKMVNSKTQSMITETCTSLTGLLLEKNRRYGDSAINPVRIFSKADNSEGIKIRLDDKINRILNNGGDIRKNDIADLLGYLILFCVSQKWTNFDDLID